MSTQMKLLIPLLDIGITKEDLSKEHGLFDAYMNNNNNSSNMDDRIYFLYDAKNPTSKNDDTFYKFLSSDKLHSHGHIQLDGHMYRLYCINVIGKNCLELYRDAHRPYYKDWIKILKFWNLEEEDVNRYAFGIDSFLEKDKQSVPEEDERIDILNG